MATRSWRGPEIQVFRGRDRQYYWRLLSANRKIVADGAEGYATSSNARRAARRVVQMMRQPVRIAA